MCNVPFTLSVHRTVCAMILAIVLNAVVAIEEIFPSRLSSFSNIGLIYFPAVD